MAAERQVSSVLVNGLLQYAKANAISEEELLESAGLRAAQLQDPDERISSDQFYRVWENLIRRVDDPGLPLHVVAAEKIADLRVMGFSVMTSENTYEAMCRATRYMRLLNLDNVCTFEEEGDVWRVRWQNKMPSRLGERIQQQAALAAFLHHARGASGAEIIPLRVAFQHPAPKALQVHRKFFRVRPLFASEHVELFIRKSDLEHLVPKKADAALNKFFVEHAEALLAELEPTADLSLRVEEMILRSLASGEPSCAHVSKRLAMSERSLRRRLQAEEITFRQLVDRVREQRSKALLADGEKSITDIAFLLGFSETSAFSRAFRRWTGLSPRRYREQGD